MIDRDQVLHVAKLARLKLTDEEVERMSGELSTILDHIETIGELDLSDVAPPATLDPTERIGEPDLGGVPPPSHVVQLENVLREDVPRPCLSREKALESAPDASDEGFRVPSPTAHA